jgi:hypothetical protein
MSAMTLNGKRRRRISSGLKPRRRSVYAKLKRRQGVDSLKDLKQVISRNYPAAVIMVILNVVFLRLASSESPDNPDGITATLYPIWFTMGFSVGILVTLGLLYLWAKGQEILRR